MTRARRWSRVRRSDEYGTFSYSSSPSTSSASVPDNQGYCRSLATSPSHHCLSVHPALTEFYFPAGFREGTYPRSHSSLGTCWTLEPNCDPPSFLSVTPTSPVPSLTLFLKLHASCRPRSPTAPPAKGPAPVRSKVKMSPSHLALLGVLGSELQLERLLILRLGEVGSSGAESRSGQKKQA